MDILLDVISVRTFWRLLLFVHFALAVGLLAALTVQAVAVLLPARQAAGNFVERFRTVPSAALIKATLVLYVANFFFGAWVYIKYRTYVRIPMEQLGEWWTVGSFEIKEHFLSMGLALLPAYWYFWRDPSSAGQDSERRWIVLFLAFVVWYSFLVGHTANDFRGVGS
jgi:hypothetical protein